MELSEHNLEHRAAAHRFEREQQWAAKLRELDEVKDAYEHGIDGKIKNTVAGLNLFDIATAGSCEGHDDWGMGAPWVNIKAPDEPDWAYVGEQEIYEKVAQKHGVPVESLQNRDNIEAFLEAAGILQQEEQDVTPEYQAWRGQNAQLRARVEELVAEFYKNLDIDPDIRLAFDTGHSSEKDLPFDLHNGGGDYMHVKEMPPEQLEGLSQRLLKYQAEMARFADFLKQKFLET